MSSTVCGAEIQFVSLHVSPFHASSHKTTAKSSATKIHHIAAGFMRRVLTCLVASSAIGRPIARGWIGRPFSRLMPEPPPPPPPLSYLVKHEGGPTSLCGQNQGGPVPLILPNAFQKSCSLIIRSPCQTYWLWAWIGIDYLSESCSSANQRRGARR